jgi:hypothetical protein
MVFSGALLAVVILVAAMTDALDWIGIGAGNGGDGESRTAVPAKTLSEDPTAAGRDPASPGQEPASSESRPEPGRTRPLAVVIQQHDYFIAGKKNALDDVIALARKVPEGAGPAVVLQRDPTSRASTEEALERLLRENKIEFEWAD